MKLTYIYHSGFAIESEGYTVIIDYYKDSSERIVHDYLLERPGRLYVLASHSHADHFNPEVLLWKEKKEDVRYVFSKDIPFNSGVTYLEKGGKYKDERIEIDAFGSTDAGISFLIKTEGRTIFHAGDLNNWHWEEESTPEEVKGYESHFFDELEFLAGAIDRIDLVMFPIDPRLGKDYTRGARQFISRIRTEQFAPMHFWEKYEKANAFKTFAESKGCRFISWSHPGESVTI